VQSAARLYESSISSSDLISVSGYTTYPFTFLFLKMDFSVSHMNCAVSNLSSNYSFAWWLGFSKAGYSGRMVVSHSRPRHVSFLSLSLAQHGSSSRLQHPTHSHISILVSLLCGLKNHGIVDSILSGRRFLIINLIEQGYLLVVGYPMIF
jgi:hypothetical protein